MPPKLWVRLDNPSRGLSCHSAAGKILLFETPLHERNVNFVCCCRASACAVAAAGDVAGRYGGAVHRICGHSSGSVPPQAALRCRKSRCNVETRLGCNQTYVCPGAPSLLCVACAQPLNRALRQDGRCKGWASCLRS
jgi:hypothetical protein